MKVWTVTEVIEKVQDEMDTQEEVFVDQGEYIEYINDAIDEAEAEIHNLYEGYFNKSAPINLIQSTASYSMPSDIYANKIKTIQYKGSDKKYKIHRIKIKDIPYVDDTDPFFRFNVENPDPVTGPQIVFYPTPLVNETGTVKVWYIRNANRVSALSDPIDIPEFASFIFAYAKWRIATKEISPLTANYEAELEKQRALMQATLSTMIPDEEETVEVDMSFYRDFDPDEWSW